MDFTLTRQENDADLLVRIDAIRNGDDIAVLESFARAYLGLFYDVDSQIPPEQRIDLLANPELAAAIKQGLMALLQHSDLPTVETIASCMLKDETLPVGFAVLAGMALYAERHDSLFEAVPEATLKAAICFHHALSTFHNDTWYLPLVTHRPGVATEALLGMWQVLVQKQSFLPGLRTVLKEPDMLPLFKELAIPLLLQWRDCRRWELYRLLSKALLHLDPEQLRAACRTVLGDGAATQMSMINQVYWHATAFLLSPEQQGQHMLNFMGQEKSKLLPLLDFVMPLLQGQFGQAIGLSPAGYAFLIRCLAQKFTPQLTISNELSEVSVKIAWLFYQLACFSAQEGEAALTGLRRVRVLKLYSGVFDSIAECQGQAVKPDFSSFVQALRDEERLRAKKDRHDVH